MIVVCANCKKVIRTKNPETEGISHGICDSCGLELYPSLWKELKEKMKSKQEVTGNI